MPFESVALKNIDVKIDDHEFIGIIGQTGCGKTTLLQVINGLLEPTKGQVFVDGVDIHHCDKRKMKDFRRMIGLTFQYPENQLFEETVFKEIAFGPRNISIKEEEIEEIVKKSLKMVGLPFETIKDRSPFSLSGGEMRRVAIASILALDPQIVILDEPTASLDPKNRNDLIQLIRNFHREYDKTIILVSHNMEIITEVSQRVLVMDRGQIIIDGPPGVIFQKYAEKLNEIGLAVPQVMNVMNRLKKMGKPVKSGLMTLEDATEEIIRLADRKMKSNEIF